MIRQFAMLVQTNVKVVSVGAMAALNTAIQHQETLAIFQRLIESNHAVASAVGKVSNHQQQGGLQTSKAVSVALRKLFVKINASDGSD